MGIISRFKDIMASNINALMDKWEDPEKMIDQYLRNLEKDLNQIKSETASVMAEEKASKRRLDDCEAEIAKMDEYARKAVTSGDDAAAKSFLSRKADLTSQRDLLQQQYTLACENSIKMKEMHDKVVTDISALKSKRDQLKAKIKVAETQKKINNLTGAGSAVGNMSKFDEMEEKINRKLDEADAMATLNGVTDTSSSLDALSAKYDDGAKATAVDDELAALKASMGLSATEGEGGTN